jgi:pyruvate dehydrogenase E2 component (dihydrolipoamide acetyltransferase)
MGTILLWIHMATVVIMPKQGQSVETCAIVGWRKKVGDAVRLGEVICEVETDKATFEVESTAEGTLLAIFHEAGSDVPVLSPIAAIGKPGESVQGLDKAGPAAAEAHAPASTAPAVTAAAAHAAPAPAGAPAAPAPVAEPGTKPTAPQAPTASPRAKALAASRGIPLVGLKGSGPGGRIIERDIEAALAQGQPATPAALAAAGGAAPAQGSGIGGRVTAADVVAAGASGAPGTSAGARASAASAPSAPPAPSAPSAPSAPLVPGKVTEIKVAGVRKIIAERMLASLQTTAQLTLNSSADARALQDMRRRFKESPEQLGLREVTINDMLLFAVSRALAAHRDLNAHFQGDTIRQYDDVHLAFAVDTPRGLMVPVIRGANARGLRSISEEARRLGEACRKGGIKPDEMSGGTFTVTNLGGLGIESFTPVLNPPQVGILGVGCIVPRPVVAADGKVSVVPHIGLSLTINHQVVDGAPGARFLQTLADAVARFDYLLAQ